MQDIRVVELFAGVGGFRVGLERCSDRFKTVWANQWEPGQAGQWAYKCYCNNFAPEDNCSNEDIEQVIDQVPEHDLLVGGFPCQDYSVAHSGAEGIVGKKGVLWWSIDKVIKRCHPRFILLENVDRLLKSPGKQRGRDFGIILRCLNDEGYCVEWRVINAADYGNAQRRRRIFIFATRRETFDFGYSMDLDPISAFCESAATRLQWSGLFARAFPAQRTSGKKHSYSLLSGYRDLVELTNDFQAPFYNSGMMVDGMVYSEELAPVCEPPICLSEIVERRIVEEKYFISGDAYEKWEYLKGAKKIERTAKNGFSYLFSEGPIAFPDPLDRPGRTMLTSEGTLNRSSHIIEDPTTGKLRRLTPVECERLNGFPDGWTDTGMPERQRYFIMGNALVVPLVTRLGQHILNLI